MHQELGQIRYIVPFNSYNHQWGRNYYVPFSQMGKLSVIEIPQVQGQITVKYWNQKMISNPVFFQFRKKMEVGFKKKVFRLIKLVETLGLTWGSVIQCKPSVKTFSLRKKLIRLKNASSIVSGGDTAIFENSAFLHLSLISKGLYS